MASGWGEGRTAVANAFGGMGAGRGAGSQAEHGLVERRRQHAAEERRGRFEEVCRALPGLQPGAPGLQPGAPAEAQRAGASSVARDLPAHGPGPPPLYAQLRRKEESRSLGGRLGFDCRLL